MKEELSEKALNDLIKKLSPGKSVSGMIIIDIADIERMIKDYCQAKFEEALPEEKSWKEDKCRSGRFCGCKVEDFNICREEMINNWNGYEAK